MEAGSDGEVTLSPETSGDSAAACCEDVPMVASRFGGLSLLRVGKFGVDLLWNPEGTGRDFGGVPLLCGGISVRRRCWRWQR